MDELALLQKNGRKNYSNVIFQRKPLVRKKLKGFIAECVSEIICYAHDVAYFRFTFITCTSSLPLSSLASLLPALYTQMAEMVSGSIFLKSSGEQMLPFT